MMSPPKFFLEHWDEIDEETGEWRLKPNAPEWAVEEFEWFMEVTNPKPDENGIIRLV